MGARGRVAPGPLTALDDTDAVAAANTDIAAHTTAKRRIGIGAVAQTHDSLPANPVLGVIGNDVRTPGATPTAPPPGTTATGATESSGRPRNTTAIAMNLSNAIPRDPLRLLKKGARSLSTTCQSHAVLW